MRPVKVILITSAIAIAGGILVPAIPSAAMMKTPPAAVADPPAEQQTDLFEFAYTWPAKANAIDPLKARLETERAQIRSLVTKQAQDDHKDAQENDYPYRGHAYEKNWQVVTDLPQWLSLSAQIYTYTGGAHGMTNFDTLLWNKKTAKAYQPLELFTSPAAFNNAVRKALCAGLDRERAKKRGADFPANDAMFTQCIDPAQETTIIFGSRNRATFDRIGFLIEPYIAGPYAEGSYDVTIPVTPAIMAAVKPEYKAAFSVLR